MQQLGAKCSCIVASNNDAAALSCVVAVLPIVSDNACCCQDCQDCTFIKPLTGPNRCCLICRAECSACPHTWFPYCANSAQYGPSTFANCCFAKCNNVPIIKSVLHAGVCLDKCGKCDPTLERPLCCKGRTYKNGCYASCNEEDTSQCSAGRCSSSELAIEVELYAGALGGQGCIFWQLGI